MFTLLTSMSRCFHLTEISKKKKKLLRTEYLKVKVGTTRILKIQYFQLNLAQSKYGFGLSRVKDN